jgi:hypothetical protein
MRKQFELRNNLPARSNERHVCTREEGKMSEGRKGSGRENRGALLRRQNNADSLAFPSSASRADRIICSAVNSLGGQKSGDSRKKEEKQMATEEDSSEITCIAIISASRSAFAMACAFPCVKALARAQK